MKTKYRVLDAMTLKPVVIHPDASLQEAAIFLKKYNVGSLLVKNGERELLGIVTEWDFTRKAIANGMDFRNTKIRDIMTTDLITVNPNMDIFEALRLMNETNVRHLPVMENNKLVGFLTVKDILKIQPQLFELIIDKYELREEERKPIYGYDEEEELDV